MSQVSLARPFDIGNYIFLRYTNSTSVASLEFKSSYSHHMAGSQLGRFENMPFIVGGIGLDSEDFETTYNNKAETIKW